MHASTGGSTRQCHLYRNLWARIARLYPLHLLTLLVTVVLVTGLPAGAHDPDFDQPTNNLKHFVLNLVLLNQIGLQDGRSFNTPTWSISTEWIVNVAFLAFISVAPKTRWVASIIIAVAALVLVAGSQRPYIQGHLAFGYLDVNLARCVIGFAAGVAVYLFLHRFGGERQLRGTPRISILLGVCSLLAMLELLIGSGRRPPVWHHLVSIGVAMGCVTFVPFSRLLQKVLRHKSLTFLGDISYSTYLVPPTTSWAPTRAWPWPWQDRLSR